MTRPHPIHWLRDHPRAADGLLAAFITVAAVTFHVLDFDTDDAFRSPSWWTTLLVIASTLPITWRRSFPIQSGLFVVAAQVITAFLDIDGTGFLGVLIGIYSVGAHSVGPRRARALWVMAASISVLFVLGVAVGELDIGGFISSTVFLVTAFVLGDNLRRRREKADSLAERAERAERENALIAQQQISAERTRIARELHDVVAHSVSVMVIQAAAARRNLHGAPDVAATALGNIEDTGRQTMTELRAILGVLRSQNDDDTLAPQPTLAEIDALIRSSGDLPITAKITGDLGDLPPSVSLTGYRVVQESITNVRRHGGPVTFVDVVVERTHDMLSITVADDGRGASADVRTTGYGVIGMRERAAALGGTAAAGARPGGGWRVAVSLPTTSEPGRHTGAVSTTGLVGKSSPVDAAARRSPPEMLSTVPASPESP